MEQVLKKLACGWCDSSHIADVLCTCKEPCSQGWCPMNVPQEKQVECVCGGMIWWQACPTGGWWIHLVHSLDDHDGTPKNKHVLVLIEEPNVLGYETYEACYCGVWDCEKSRA